MTIIRPDNDILTTGWSSTGGSFYTEIDETSASDADYVESSTVGAKCRVGLETAASLGTTPTLTYRAASPDSGNGLIARVIESGSFPFIIPQRKVWTRQPQTPTWIARGNPITRGLAFAWIASVGNIDLVSGRPITRTVPRSVYRNEIAKDFTEASSQYLDCGTGPNVTFTGDMTIMSCYKLKTNPGAGNGYILFARDSNSGGRSYTFDVANSTSAPVSGVRLYVNGGGTVGTNQINEGRSVSAGDDRTALAVWQPSTNRSEIWIDGVLANSAGAVTTPPSATTSARLGGRTYASYEDYMNGYIPFVFIWKRGLLQQEIRSMFARKWQIFASRTAILSGDPGYQVIAERTPSLSSSPANYTIELTNDEKAKVVDPANLGLEFETT